MAARPERKPEVTSTLTALKFDERGLVPAVVQDRLTGEVRMVAWMNHEALEKTLETKRATFYSRSRQSLWVKGETSGHVLEVHDVLADCDGDTLLVLVDPAGPSCHTGRENCFFEAVEEGGTRTTSPALPFLERLEGVLEERKLATGEKSYTRSLFDGGVPKIGKKIVEEAGEVVEALDKESDERVASEAADVLYHLLVGLRFRGVPFRAVLETLAGRFGTGGHAEKASRSR
jgi:phosphoribosyl-ATP pyrophosphohydrolase/phosphoribosyl-AMP cyclohydrolase